MTEKNLHHASGGHFPILSCKIPDYQLFASSVEEELSLGMKDDCKEKVDETLKALELSDYRERHPHPFQVVKSRGLLSVQQS